MNKEEFLKELDEIVEDKMFIGNGIEDLEEEISQNTWSISMSQQLANEFTVIEMRNFFCKVISNRGEQIGKSNCKNGMIFYVWFDWLSGRLRFNLITDIHTKLPFKCKIERLENIDSVINEFLTYPYHDGIPFEEATDDDEGIKEDTEVDPLNVFLYRIEK
ncbi:hypothetical protein [Paenibacillus sp. Soil522]|uniref:hypothetical protein n=1 Tax=Paenibacillus sp. Soil522 TaxID=1736388 RepID=UPI0006FBEFA1|nr:hypothetical protein [Paenibacillus sp. Soil522]KRE50589.1 hypothetical protein ASG81_03825 [Paenibacillus sp. Soil522]